MNANFIQTLPILFFLYISRFITMGEKTWLIAFVGGAACAVAVGVYVALKKIPINWCSWGANLFLFLGATAILLKITPLLTLIRFYRGPSFMACVAVTLVIRTLYAYQTTGTRTIVPHIQMVALACVGVLHALITNHYGTMISAALPYIALRILDDYIVKR